MGHHYSTNSTHNRGYAVYKKGPALCKCADVVPITRWGLRWHIIHKAAGSWSKAAAYAMGHEQKYLAKHSQQLYMASVNGPAKVGYSTEFPPSIMPPSVGHWYCHVWWQCISHLYTQTTFIWQQSRQNCASWVSKTGRLGVVLQRTYNPQWIG